MTARLAAFTVTNWVELDGILQLEGVDLLDLPFDRALNVVYAVLVRNKDDKERSKFENELTRPMRGEALPSTDPLWGEDAQGAMFLAAMNAQEG